MLVEEILKECSFFYNSRDEIRSKKELSTYKVSINWYVSKKVLNISVWEKSFNILLNKNIQTALLGTDCPWLGKKIQG